MSATEPSATPVPARRRQPWDPYRKISAWLGLLALASVIVILVTVGNQLTGAGGEQDPSTTWTIVGLLAGPAVLAGIVSGSRFYALYAGYSKRLDPTAPLSQADAASGGSVVNGYIGDGLWGSLIAGLAAGIPAAIALTFVLGPFALIMMPVLGLVAALAWFTGWVSGAVASMLVSAAIGMAVGASSLPNRRTRLPWYLVAAFLPALLISVSLAAAVRFPDGSTNIPAGLVYLLGLPLDGEFLLGQPLLIVVRVLAWLTVALFVCLVIVGLPALLNRGRSIPVPNPLVEAEQATPPVPGPQG